MSEVTKESGNLIDLTEFKRNSRLKRKEKRNAAKRKALTSAQSSRSTKLIQNTEVSRISVDTWHVIAARYLAIAGIALLTLAEIGIALVIPDMQASALPEWVTIFNEWLPRVRNLGAILVMLSLPTLAKQSLKHALGAWPIYIGLVCWSFYNTSQWTNTTSVSASIGKTDTRQLELESKYDVPVKRQRYEDAKVAEDKVISDKDRQCSKNDGSVCQTFVKTTVPSYTKAREAAWKEYKSAKDKAEQQARSELKPTITSDNSKLINTILPLIGGILFMLVK
jgi:hypothetical protein